MIIWLNGAFGSGKTTCAYELQRRLKNAFVYDPENIGFFIRKNIPKQMQKSDFQDYKQWRNFNYDLLQDITQSYDGIIIVPMTITNRTYYNEIIQRLIHNNIQVKHYILSAEKTTLMKRLNRRFEYGNTWGKQQIDRCIHAFHTHITEEKIITDTKSVTEIVEEIAIKSELTLLPDHRSTMKKWFDQLFTSIKHIRS